MDAPGPEPQRSPQDLDEINGKGASVKFLKDNLTSVAGVSDPMAEVQLHIMGSFAQFERVVIR